MINLKQLNVIDSKFFQYKNKIMIYEGNFHLETEEKDYCLNGEVYMIFEPMLDIRLKGTTKERIDFIEEENILLSIPGMLPTEVYITSSKNDKYFEGNIHQIHNTKNPLMDSYILHIINYVDFIGSVVRSTERSYRGEIHLEIDGWNIKIQKRHDYKEKDIFKVLKNNQGYGITHIIEIKRIDGKKFNKNDASKIVDVLTCVFNISSGRHISMPIEIGMVNKKIIYENYQIQLISPYRVMSNWFPKHRGEVLKDLFYKIYSKFDDEYIQRVIKEVIHQYIEILETRFLENKIIHSQIALEKLSYVLLTQQSPKIISNTQFKKNAFKRNLELILNELAIEVELNKEYNFFKSDFNSSPHLLAGYRNHIAHPKPKPVFEGYSVDKKFLILKLSIYYTEMLMLYLIGYDDIYSNILKIPLLEGDYEKLPWNIKSGDGS